METLIDDTPPISSIIKEIMDNMGQKYKVRNTLVNISVLDYFNPTVYQVNNQAIIHYLNDNMSGGNLLNMFIELFFSVNSYKEFITGVNDRLCVEHNKYYTDTYFVSLYHFLEYLLRRLGIPDNRRDLVDLWGIEDGILVATDVVSEEGYLEIEEFITDESFSE